MTTPWQTALIEHRRGFAAERAGRLDLAVGHFRAALAGFAAVLDAPAWHADLGLRAERIVPENERDALLGDFLRQWPRWLLDLHYERTLHAVRVGDQGTAVYHWGVLVAADTLLAHLGTDTLSLYRDRLALACLPGAGAGLADQSDAERLALLQQAQRLLAVDPAIVRARLFAMRVCIELIEGLLRQEREAAQQRRRGDSRLLRGMAKADRRAQVRIGRLARVLSRHLRVLGPSPQADTLELVAGYRVLAAYLGLSEPCRALRVLRRARRIAPDDQELRAMYRALRRAGGC
ncbi:hypothetical protein [uncultured Thiodictyon sp.]|jgi:hypothetical protein|uniref:hypothetical protein n=1 Tax=uncultured Thiodictyon sp. TaxID=1846217 RepID=UPI0025F21299|nr:hypothetical protein [uncultured Thiodictyon sp.]